jgi:hypothetical protein
MPYSCVFESYTPVIFFILIFFFFYVCGQIAGQIIEDHRCGSRRNRSTTDHIFCVRQIVEKKWEYNEAVYQLCINFKKAYDSVRREVLYNILTEFGIRTKLVRLIKMCLNDL